MTKKKIFSNLFQVCRLDLMWMELCSWSLAIHVSMTPRNSLLYDYYKYTTIYTPSTQINSRAKTSVNKYVCLWIYTRAQKGIHLIIYCIGPDFNLLYKLLTKPHQPVSAFFKYNLYECSGSPSSGTVLRSYKELRMIIIYINLNIRKNKFRNLLSAVLQTN